MKAVPFVEDPQRLQVWMLTAGMAAAEAVLVHPPRTKGGGQQIMVLKGSMLQEEEKDSCSRSVANIRARLISFGKLKDRRDGTLYLNEHIVFASPSQAANVVHGESKNGWLFWRLGSHHGPSLDEVTEMERRGETELIYYEKPEGVIEIPSRFS